MTSRLLGKLDALLHLAMGLKKREDSRLVKVVAVFFYKGEELALKYFDLLLFYRFLLSEDSLVHTAVLVHFDPSDGCDFGQLELSDPCGYKEALGRPLVLRLGHILVLFALGLLLGSCFSCRLLLELFQHELEVVDQTDALVGFEVLQADSFEAETTLDVEGGSCIILTLLEELVGEDGRHVGSLLCRATVVQSYLDILLFQEVLPGVLVFTLERG